MAANSSLALRRSATRVSATGSWSRRATIVRRSATYARPVLQLGNPISLQEDFILTARAKGVSRRSVLLKHALRPSLFSFVTVFALTTGALIGGALIIENIFLIPGLGRALYEAVLREDFPVVLAIVMIGCAAYIIVNLVVELVYSLIDPRVRR